MKHLILFLGILFSGITMQVQVVANQPTPLEACEETQNDGIAEFDLTIKDSEIIGSQDPSNLVLTYHLTQNDADAGTNEIDPPQSYMNVYNPQTIFPRLENSVTGEYDTTILILVVNPVPTPAGPTPLVVCDEFYNDGFGIFDLTMKDVEIANGDPAVVIRYFESQAKAEAGEFYNYLPSPYQNIVPFLQTVYVRVENDETACYTVVSMDLVVQELPPITQPINLVVIDDNGDGFAIFDLTENEAIMLEGLDSSDYYVTYYEFEMDAVTGANPIAPTESYENTLNPQTIFVRVENINTGCYVIASFEIYAGDPVPRPDADNDGIPDADEDLNGNGNLEDDDTDVDGIPNYLDSDDDGDGVETIAEITGIGAGVSPATYTYIDTDGDGIENYLDDDDDGDGTLTIDEDYNNNGTPLDDDINGNGIPDFLDDEVFLSVESFDFDDLSIFPNPTSDSFTIQSSQLVSETTVSIYDIQGRMVFSEKRVSPNGVFTLNVSSFENGVYFVKISSEGNMGIKKLIKR